MTTFRQIATVYTDDATAYEGLAKYGYTHETVTHSVGEYVRDQAHTNGAESFWPCLKRGYYGVYHKMSPKQLQEYVDQFCARQHVRELDTMIQIDTSIFDLFGKRLKHANLIVGIDGWTN